MKIKTTTALKKISSLKKRIWGIQGGQGAGKTYAILLILLNFALGNSAKEIYIVSAELSKMRDTVIKDCVSIIKEFAMDVKVTGIVSGTPRIDFENGSFIRFIGLDKEDVGKGLRSDVVFVNEANKTNFETYRELTSRAKRVIIDFNPNSKFWFHKEVQTRKDCEFLKLTYLDNEFLSKEEVYEIENYRTQAYKHNASGEIATDTNGNKIVKSEYWLNKWKVYGLGEVGSVEGRIYYWKSIYYDDYLKIDAPHSYFVDWGAVDPFAVGEAKYYDGNLYLHEINYASENEIRKQLTTTELHQIKGNGEDGLIPHLFNKWNIDKKRSIICDNNRPNKVIALRRSGWEQAFAIGGKSKLLDRIDTMQQLNIYYTSTSKNLEYEQMNYKYKVDKFGNQLEQPEDANNHLIDGASYKVQELFDEGVIKKV